MNVNVAILGATGAVGREMISILEERKFPVNNLTLLSSKKSAGTNITFNNSIHLVEEVTANSFKNIDLALFSAGGNVSKIWAPQAVKMGAVVVDNSSAWRMTENVPLIVPEVNYQDAVKHQGIISNPNCSTIQMVMALKPLQDLSKIKRIIVSTYQAVSGSGNKAVEELKTQIKNTELDIAVKSEIYPHQIAYNCLPHIDKFEDNGYTKEEMKMIEETHKILGDPEIAVNATTVRVPVFRGHSESIYVETEDHVSISDFKTALANFPGIELMDSPSNNIYPTPLHCEKKDSVFVGRIRQDLFCPKAITMWVVSDNLRKGAALNAVQIGELLFK